MNTTPANLTAADGPQIGVATARLLLELALEREQQAASAESPELAHKHALNKLTGASIHLQPIILPVKP